MFLDMSDVQMIWYQYQYNIDDQENFELLRHMEEHNAMFMNPEGVQKLRDSRANKFEMPEKDFKDHVHNLFGRELPNLSENNMSIEEYLRNQEKNGIEEYLGMELDDISFTPMG